MRRVVLLAAGVAALAVPTVASAHPLGNFTINHSSSIVASGDRVYVDYVLDMAEIPTLQARQAGGFNAPALSRSIAAKLSLTVNGRRVALRPAKHRLQFLPGAAGLRTTRLEVVLAGPAVREQAAIRFHDDTYPGRLGWKEVVVAATSGAGVVTSSAPAVSPSDQLRAYPKDRLSSPVEVTAATATLAAGTGHGATPAFSEPVEKKPASGFTSLVERRDLGAAGVLAALAIALFWGAAHALGPGHGKSIVAAYLIGQRGSVRHAIGLGGIVTVTHTAGVFALGVVTLALSELIVPEDLYPWLNLVAGLMVVAIGIGVLRARLAKRSSGHGHHGHHHPHDHEHEHGHEHGHEHHHDHTDLSLRSLVTVGVSGGLLPCPSALVVLLAAISLHRIAFGLALVLAFSVGLAFTISTIGLVAVLANGVFRRASFEGRLVKALPAVSALIIVAAGIVMTARALPTVG